MNYPLEAFLEPAVDAIPLSRDLDYREMTALVASSVEIGAVGLRAVVVCRPLRNAVQDYNGVNFEARVLEAYWEDQGGTDGSGPVFATDTIASSKVGRRGDVRRDDDGYAITLPREQDGVPGRRLRIAHGTSDILQALYEVRVANLSTNT